MVRHQRELDEKYKDAYQEFMKNSIALQVIIAIKQVGGLCCYGNSHIDIM